MLQLDLFPPERIPCRPCPNCGKQPRDWKVTCCEECTRELLNEKGWDLHVEQVLNGSGSYHHHDLVNPEGYIIQPEIPMCIDFWGHIRSDF